MIRLSVVVTLLLAGLAFADVVTEVDGLYNDGEFEQALKKADAAIASSKTTTAQAAKLHLTRGLCLLAIGQQDKAKAAFVSALKKDASVELDPSKVGADAFELFEKARAQFPAMLSIGVAGDLPGKVKLDGQSMGPAPLTTQVSPGKHVVEVVASDGRTARSEVVAKSGATQTLKLEYPAAGVAKVDAPTKVDPVKTEPVKSDPAKVEPTRPTTDEPPPPMPPVETTASGPPPNLIGIAPLGVAVAAGVVAAISFGEAQRNYDLLTTGTAHLLPAEENSAVESGTTFQTVGWICLPVAVAAAAAGVTLLVLQPGRDAKVAVSGFIGPDGASAMSVRGTFP